MVRNSMSRRMPDWRWKLSAISCAFFSVIPGISVRRMGSCSSTVRLWSPKRPTIFSAVRGPMPLTAREDKNARISLVVSGMRRSRNSASNCWPKLWWRVHLPTIASRSPTTLMGMVPTTVTVSPCSVRTFSTQ